MIHNNQNEGGNYICIVSPSRYRKILSDYHSLNGINVEGLLDNYATNYKSYLLYNLDGKNNSYRIVKDKESKEVKGKCTNCNCNSNRWVDPDTGECYYNKMIKTNYTTKINQTI